MAQSMRVFSEICGHRTGLRLAAALVAGLALAGCLGFDGVVNRGAVMEPRRVTQVKPGMDAQQVLSILGTPSTTSTVGGDAWYYVSQRLERSLAFMQANVADQRVVAVYFDKSRKVQRIADYGLEDGKPIDFLSRTTPVAAAEYHLLQAMMSKFAL
jgi:outer membrane protein assembly factor BamE (lipoprotein component of BamABCDE complex)